MTHIEDLEQRVRELYSKLDPARFDWCSWLAQNHVFVVADNAEKLAKRFGGREDLARAAGMLHDIADAKIGGRGPKHEEMSLTMARDLMQQSGFTKAEIEIVVEDAIRWHSCHGDDRPKSLEGKILAAADSMAHLQTDFYVYAAWMQGQEGISLADAKAWTLKKIDRDLNVKIMFDEVRDECQADYNAIKRIFSK